MRVNGVATGYRGKYLDYGTTDTYNAGTYWRLYDDGTGAISTQFNLNIQREETNSEMTGLTGNAFSDDEVDFLGGRVDAGGTLTSITFDDYASDSAFTGEINVYCWT
jgi:hypothetical protein